MKKGIVIKSTGSWYTVKDAESKDVVPCKIRGQMRTKGSKSTNPVAVGDDVEYEYDEQNKVGVIQEVAERKNYIIRKSTNLSRQSHVIAANIDQAILMVTIVKPILKIEFLDRYLATAEAYRIPAILVFNKTDVYAEKDHELLHYLIEIYSRIGYKCLQTSVIKEDNIDKIKELLKNKTSLISGNSGVGKTSLINCLSPKIDLKTESISDYHKMGKHTTTFAEMIDLPFGGSIIDTPGIKGFGLVNVDKDEIYHFFPEIFKTAQGCAFYNCSHIHEPDCAVIEAVQNGEIAESRYRSYFNLYHEENEKYRK